MKHLLIFFLLQGIVSASFSQETDTITDSSVSTTFDEVFGEDADAHALPDTSKIAARSFDDRIIRDLKSDPSLRYKESPTIAESLWDRFLVWINQFINSIFENAVATDWGRVMAYVVGMVVLIVLIMTLLKVNAFKVFYSGQGANTFSYTALDENIHEMDFDRLILEAASRNDYRLGIRLLFLYALKMLSDKNLIHWDKGKTNHDYLNELNPTELKHGFNELNSYFEYAWYGNFRVKQETFARVQRIFVEWSGKLK